MDSIRVWVAVDLAGRPTEHISYVSGDAALLMAAQWHKWSIEVDTSEKMKELGWTTREATLTLTPVKDETE